MNQSRRNRRIDTARKGTQHLAIANLSLDILDNGSCIFTHCPVTNATAYLKKEVFENNSPVFSMHNLWMELDSIKAFLNILYCSIFAGIRRRGSCESLRQDINEIGMAHPCDTACPNIFK